MELLEAARDDRRAVVGPDEGAREGDRKLLPERSDVDEEKDVGGRASLTSSLMESQICEKPLPDDSRGLSSKGSRRDKRRRTKGPGEAQWDVGVKHSSSTGSKGIAGMFSRSRVATPDDGGFSDSEDEELWKNVKDTSSEEDSDAFEAAKAEVKDDRIDKDDHYDEASLPAANSVLDLQGNKAQGEEQVEESVSDGLDDLRLSILDNIELRESYGAEPSGEPSGESSASGAVLTEEDFSTRAEKGDKELKHLHSNSIFLKPINLEEPSSRRRRRSIDGDREGAPRDAVQGDLVDPSVGPVVPVMEMRAETSDDDGYTLRVELDEQAAAADREAAMKDPAEEQSPLASVFSSLRDVDLGSSLGRLFSSENLKKKP